jgi:hypothetical protein
MTVDSVPQKLLTPREEQQARDRVRQEAMGEFAFIEPRPSQVTLNGRMADFVRFLQAALRTLLGSVPFWVILVIMGAAIVSIDKMTSAFAEAAAHQDSAGMVAFGGVLVVEFGLLYLAFADRADRLKDDSQDDQRGITLVYLLHAAFVMILGGLSIPATRIGRFTVGPVRVPSRTHLPPMQRPIMTVALFGLALAGNLYGVAFAEALDLSISSTTTIHEFFMALSELPFNVSVPVYMRLVLGATAPLALFLFGEELARVSFETDRRYTDDILAERDREWRAAFTDWYRERAEALEQAEMARSFRLKNSLPIDAPTPYLLVAGTAEEEANNAPIPLAQTSSPPSSDTRYKSADYPLDPR